jgi:aspartate aminotransferase/aminotransferase
VQIAECRLKDGAWQSTGALTRHQTTKRLTKDKGQMTTQWLSARTAAFDSSGIRKVFDLAAKMKDPINLSIGQPDFDVPAAARQAMIDAVSSRKNGYAQTQGIAPLLEKLQANVSKQFGHADRKVFVTSGTSGGLLLVMMALVNPGDEVILFDPYFITYEPLVKLMGGKAVLIDTYPDFKIDLAKVRAAITPKTKAILIDSPGNPTGVVATPAEVKGLAELAAERGVALISDEIYSRFCYFESSPAGRGQGEGAALQKASKNLNQAGSAPAANAGNSKQSGTLTPALSQRERGNYFVSPAKYNDKTIVVEGFSKSYAMTGWRVGFAHGPAEVIDGMLKLQQYTFVCAPQPAQWACVTALDENIQPLIDHYRRKRDMVIDGLKDLYEVIKPEGAFYVFPKVPAGQGTATEFVERCIANQLLVIPGKNFSMRDTHFRLSYAAEDRTIERGIEVLRKMAKGTV